jgi:hypothetical protein
MLNACLTLSWPNNVPFDREAGRLFRLSGLPATHCTRAGVVGHGGRNDKAKEQSGGPRVHVVPGKLETLPEWLTR